MSWTDERIATLKKLWEGGSTASQIAEQLGGVSRNAVIGKAHRLGLKSRPSPVKAAAKKKASAKPTAKKTAAGAQTKKRSTPALKPASGSAKSTASASVRSSSDSAAPRSSASAHARSREPSAATTSDAKRVASEPSQPLPNAQKDLPKIVSVGPGGFLRQGPGDQQAPIPPAPPRRLVPAKPSPEIADKTSLLDLNDRVCRWPMGHPGEPDFHFCGEPVNPGFPYCVEHCGRAFQAQLPRGTRRPPPPLPFGGPRVR